MGLDMEEASWKCVDQNKQEQHGDIVMCFYSLSDPEEVEEAFYKIVEWTSHSQSQWV